MKQQIQQDLKNALLQKDELKVGTLRMVLAALITKEKENPPAGRELTEEEAQKVLLAEAKKRKEAAVAFGDAGRKEMAEKEQKELEILQTYLPEQLSEEEIRTLVKEAIHETKASSMQDMGKVMAALMPKLQGKADGAQVSSITKELLG